MPPLHKNVPACDDVTRADDPAGPPFVVEAEQRLSRSKLWSLTRRYYDQAGIEAWRGATVPCYVTNNPHLAHAYAQVFLGFLRDLRASAEAPAEPVTIVEIGAGSGRFAYLFLRALTDLLRRSPLAGARFRYVMTDFAEANVRFFQAHASLRPFVEQGLLDFALFDAERDHEIRLLHAGVTLAPGSLASPLVVVANYVFDTLRQDAFSFADGALRACAVTLTSEEPIADLDDPAILGKVSPVYSFRPAPLDFYDEPGLNAILRGYVARSEGATVLFPFAAIRAVDRLAALASGRMLLLSADYDHLHEAADPEAAPRMLVHGSLSMPVNYHAIAEHVRARGGRVLAPTHQHAHLAISAFLLGAASGHEETQLAFEEAVERASPDDIFALRREILDGKDRLGLGQALSLIRWSRYDPYVLRDCLPTLWAHVHSASTVVVPDVVHAVSRAWDAYYPIGEALDLAFELGLLLHAYGASREAIALFEASIRLYGDDPRARWNIGLCHYALGDLPLAFACFGEAGRRWPEWRPAGALQVKT